MAILYFGFFPNAILVRFLTFIQKIADMVYIPRNWKTKTVSESRCDKWIKNPTWRSANHEVEPKCLTLQYRYLEGMDQLRRSYQPIVPGYGQPVKVWALWFKNWPNEILKTVSPYSFRSIHFLTVRLWRGTFNIFFPGAHHCTLYNCGPPHLSWMTLEIKISETNCTRKLKHFL